MVSQANYTLKQNIPYLFFLHLGSFLRQVKSKNENANSFYLMEKAIGIVPYTFGGTSKLLGPELWLPNSLFGCGARVSLPMPLSVSGRFSKRERISLLSHANLCHQVLTT